MQRARFAVVVHVALVDAGRLVLLRRANTGFMDGYFALPGGHQERGETLRQAAQRECREEVGLQPVELELLAVLTYPSARSRGLNFVFTAPLNGSEPRLCEPEHFDVCGSFALTDLPVPTVDWVADLIEPLTDCRRRPVFLEYE